MSRRCQRNATVAGAKWQYFSLRDPQGGPRSIAKLVQITPITMVCGTYNYSLMGFINQLITGGLHIVAGLWMMIPKKNELKSRFWPIPVSLTGVSVSPLPKKELNMCLLPHKLGISWGCMGAKATNGQRFKIGFQQQNWWLNWLHWWWLNKQCGLEAINNRDNADERNDFEHVYGWNGMIHWQWLPSECVINHDP